MHGMPVVSLTQGALVGYEAPARWRSSNGQILLPEQFLEVMGVQGVHSQGVHERVQKWGFVRGSRCARNPMVAPFQFPPATRLNVQVHERFIRLRASERSGALRRWQLCLIRVDQRGFTGQRCTRALPPAASERTSERLAIDVSPGVVIAKAP